ncbi:hypothetical protein Sme01_58910 [Sphaerisporangium melleum]|uniref:Uncharacterized protein n=1 Tax=Sphaerisporangium melleum TaxID=321316 RepID=A0A917VLM4_9ACTN|nr:hypothetical protein [Sphaerisporangium melleum]GGK93399.1 hypothetical protein GCM10007964_39840 [Sphaerisporangium melleum]GII73415.1 hypothetical protein Sme01_58910 [Sphaerisporangium melleum]
MQPKVLCFFDDGEPPVRQYNGVNELPPVPLCQKHDAEPKTWCDGCPPDTTLLTVGTTTYFKEMNYTAKPRLVAPHNEPNPYSLLTMCANCAKADRCRACQTPAYRADQQRALRGATLVAADDARCGYCSAAPVTDNDLLTLVPTTRAWITSWFAKYGGKFPQDIPGFTVELVPASGLAGATEKGIQTGACVRSGEKTGTKVVIKSYTIKVLAGMRKPAFLETLTHELTHIWIFEEGLEAKPLVEGFCNYVALQRLKDLQEEGGPLGQEAEQRIAYMHAQQGAVYGGNMKALNLMAKNPGFNPVGHFRQ